MQHSRACEQSRRLSVGYACTPRKSKQQFDSSASKRTHRGRKWVVNTWQQKTDVKRVVPSSKDWTTVKPSKVIVIPDSDTWELNFFVPYRELMKIYESFTFFMIRFSFFACHFCSVMGYFTKTNFTFKQKERLIDNIDDCLSFWCFISLCLSSFYSLRSPVVGLDFNFTLSWDTSYTPASQLPASTLWAPTNQFNHINTWHAWKDEHLFICIWPLYTLGVWWGPTNRGAVMRGRLGSI